jgi:16S rRNA (cytosine1402-N4)-methyltransferase
MPADHLSVLLQPSIEALNVRPAGIYLDGTFGRGGHSRLIMDSLGEDGRLIAIDRDPQAVAYAEEMFAGDTRFEMVHSSFDRLGDVAEQSGVMGRVDGILLDLGVSSPQLDQAERGFSFGKDGPLDMRMDNTQGESAADWLKRAESREIAEVLKVYGEERHAKRIARAIVAAREEAPIETTGRLAEVVAKANPSWEKNKHPATRSFQAIRIHINGELEAIKTCLGQVLEVLALGGRLAVISFHSLEDRIVKRFMRDQAKGDSFPPGVPVREDQLQPRLKLIGKAISPSEEEIDVNPRARSAVLRVAERLA